MDDSLKVQDDIASEVVRALGPSIDGTVRSAGDGLTTLGLRETYGSLRRTNDFTVRAGPGGQSDRPPAIDDMTLPRGKMNSHPTQDRAPARLFQMLCLAVPSAGEK